MSRTPLPQSLVWEVTARCNLHCSHCYNIWTTPGRTPPEELGTAEAMRILDKVRASAGKLKSLTFTGGEPLLRRDLPILIAAARRLFPKAQLNLATNGQLLTLPIATELRNAGVNTVQLSLLSAKPATHDRMTGVAGSFEPTLAAIACAKRAGLGVAVFFVATRENIADFAGTARLAAALGADAMVFNRFQPGGRGLLGWKQFTPSPEQLEQALARFDELRSVISIGMGTLIPPCEVSTRVEGRRPQGCPIGTAHAYPTIGPDGTLRPCNHTPVSAGSLLQLPLAELLQQPCMGNPQLAQLPRRCADCRLRVACRSGCIAAQELAGEFIYAHKG